MHDEFRGSIARQGITEEAYLKAIDKTEADLHTEFRPGAEKRVRTLLVLSKVADVEGVVVPDAEVEEEVARGRERYARRCQAPRRTSTRSAAVPTSAARFAAAGSSKGLSMRGSPPIPTIPPLPHVEEARRRTAVAPRDEAAAANAAIDATDPGSVLADVPAAAG